MPIHIYLSHADYDSINNEKYINRLYIRIRDAKLFGKLDRIEQDGRKAEIIFHRGVGSKNKLKRNVRALPLGLYRKLNGECFLKVYNDKKATDLISYILAMVTAIALALWLWR